MNKYYDKLKIKRRFISAFRFTGGDNDQYLPILYYFKDLKPRYYPSSEEEFDSFVKMFRENYPQIKIGIRPFDFELIKKMVFRKEQKWSDLL